MKFYNLRDTATGLFWETISGTWIEKGSQPVEPTVYDQDDGEGEPDGGGAE